jgi:hypothetical protein
MPADEEGGLALGSGVWGEIVRPSRSTSKRPSKKSLRGWHQMMLWFLREKVPEEAEGSSSPGYTGGKGQGERRCERVP